MEPELQCTGALLSPATGIVDSHRLMLALQGDAEDDGAMHRLPQPGASAVASPTGASRSRSAAAAPMQLARRLLVNTAGLHAPDAGAPDRRRDAIRTASRPPTTPRATTSRLSGRSPFSRLIYPVPVPGGLGVHITVDLGGQARFGPDVEWIDEIDYAVDPRARRQVLCRGAPLLAGAEGRRAAAGLCRHPAEDRATRRAGAGLHLPRSQEASHPGPDSSLRHRVAGPHRVFGDRRACASDDTRVMTGRGRQRSRPRR